MINCNLKKILYIPLVLLVAVAVVMNVVPASVYAVEIESLPVEDEDLKISYDSDSVRIEDNGAVYEIPFNQDVRIDNGSGGLVHLLKHINPIDVWVGNSTVYVSTHTNSDVDGNAVPFSYWYSPSEKRVYTFTGHGDYYYVDSYSNGVFHFYDIPDSGHFLVFGYFDLINGNYKPMTVLGGQEGSYQLESGYTLSSYNDYEDIDGSSHTVNIPSDLICVYSSYEISGFYEPDDISVFTPDYYFNFQYIYYKEDVGYTFIDSARPIKYIESVAGGTYANIVFDEACNKHIYTSTDGVNWSLKSSVVDMYGIQYQLPHNWFYGSVGGSVSAVLIYTNDEGYAEEPLVTPEFGDIEDITGSLNNIILEGAPLPSGGRGNGYTFEELKLLNELEYYDFIMYGLTHEFYTRYKVVYDDDGVEYFYDLESGRYGSFRDGERSVSYIELEYIPTVSAYMYDVNMTLDDFVSLYQLYSEAMHMDMKAIFDNITNTNTYLYDVKGLIQDMPDYSSKLTNVLNVLNNSNGSLNEINEKLDNIVNLMSSGSVPDSGESSPDDGSGSSSTTNSNITQDFLVTLDDEMLVVLNEIDNSIDKLRDVEVFDNVTDVTEEVYDNFIDDMVDDESIEDMFTDDFVQSAVSSIATGSLINGTFSGITSSGAAAGVSFVNANVTNLYNASGKLQSVILLGVTMTVVGIVVRKGV